MRIFRLQGLKSGIFQISFLFIAYFLMVPVCHAQAPEQITITTYYPSPYGVYQGLEARRMVIGIGAPTNPMPTEDGVVNFQERPTNPAFAQEGMLYYNSVLHMFYYRNQTTWVPLGGCTRFSYGRDTGHQTCPRGTATTFQELTPRTWNGYYSCCPTQ